MLVLTRKEGESVVIGGDIIVEVVAVRGDKVKLGITAPSNVPVHRKEVWLAIQREGQKRPENKGESNDSDNAA